MDEIYSECFLEYNDLKKTKDFDINSFERIWEYQTTEGWSEINAIKSYEIERNFQKGIKIFEIEINDQLYFMNLDFMVQENLQSGNFRVLRRGIIFEQMQIVTKTGEIESEEEKNILIKNICEKLDEKDLTKTILEKKCSICLETFDQKFGSQHFLPICKLKGCKGHYFHIKCDDATTVFDFVKKKKSCPVCRILLGPPTGDCPPSIFGLKRINLKLDGFDSLKTWLLMFIFPPGIQSENHQNPGNRYFGEKRVAFLPDSEEGRKVLALFLKAYQRRLLFTIGYSLTRQMNNVIIYNGIHMKTSITGLHGYPDSNYLDRVKEEFKNKGVF